jgi:hypothetical protein
MKHFETINPINSPKFSCQLCGIKTNNKKDYNKHLMTEKHKAKSECNIIVTIIEDNIPKKSPYQYICNKCKRVINCRVSFWRHKKKCNEFVPISDEENIKLLNESGIKPYDEDDEDIGENVQLDIKANITAFCDKDLIMMLIKQNSELMEMLKNGTTSHSHNTTNHMNSHNKTFNLQFFLNETCKDAMNITEFIENIKIDVSDLENMGRVGYVEGMSNILIKNLNTLDVSKRPIHCTDKKREIMYIKDNNVWEKDDEQKNKLHKTIKRVSHKSIKTLPEYREKYPGCEFAISKFSDNYNKMIIEVMGGSGDNDIEKEDKIIQKVAKHITINKCINNE